jgi:hypothetical protein
VETYQNVKVVAVETQTELSNLHSESICCLSHIPYADMTNSPPPPSPRIKTFSKKRFNNPDNPEEPSEIPLNDLEFAIDASVVGAKKIETKNNNGDFSQTYHIDSEKTSSENL